MAKLKGLKIVLLILMVALILVIARTTGKNRFKQDAQNAIEAVENNNFSISMNDFAGSENQDLVVEISNSEMSGSLKFDNSIKVPFEKLLDENTLQKFKETKKMILLVSEDFSALIKAWVILNQLDFKNVFVLSNEENPEVLRYEFQPDPSEGLKSISER